MVDNTPPPGGQARTIGFWKNWSSCAASNGNQRFVLDETLAASGGIALGTIVVRDCLSAVRLLGKQDIRTAAKMASDAAYLAAQLLAVRLSVAPKAGACAAATSAMTSGQALLTAVGFTGTCVSATSGSL